MSDLGSGVTTLETLFTNRSFRVPPYQRHYAWEERQLSEFINDLSNASESRGHFLGTLLFMRPAPDPSSPSDMSGASGSSPYKVFDIVDGQQRLTTAVLFMNAVRHAQPTLLRRMQVRNFVYDEDEIIYKFQTVPEDWPFFRAVLDGGRDAMLMAQTPSQKRLEAASKYFAGVLSTHDRIQVERWIRTLSGCTILVHSVDGYGEAVAVFETVNDRGKKLTDLEGLKSFLMRIVGITNQPVAAERQAIEEMQGSFADVYRMINRFERDMPEDAALRQCYFTFPRVQVDGQIDYWNGGTNPKDSANAKDDAKNHLLGLVSKGHYRAAFDASLRLARHIRNSFQKIEAVINNTPRC